MEEAMKLASMHRLVHDDNDASSSGSSSSSEDNDDAYSTLALLHPIISQHQYLSHVQDPIPKSQDFIKNYFLSQRDSEFKTTTWVNCKLFF